MSYTTVLVQQRKICWPTPDGCCLKGGCVYCSECGAWKDVDKIEKYAFSVGLDFEFFEGDAAGVFISRVVHRMTRSKES